MEREDEKEIQHRIGAVLVILALILALVSLGLLIYFVTLPPPPEPRCGYGSRASAQLEATETLVGYRFKIDSVSEIVPLDCFEVIVIKDGTSLFPDLPANVTEGVMGLIQGGENLDFTDSDGDGRLTRGDYFALERLDSGTVYELALIWGANHNLVGSEAVQTP